MYSLLRVSLYFVPNPKDKFLIYRIKRVSLTRWRSEVSTMGSYTCIVIIIPYFRIMRFFIWKNLSLPSFKICLSLSGRHLFNYAFMHSPIYLFIHLFIYSFVHLFIYSFIHLFIYSFVHLFICSFVHLFIFSFIHLFIYSFFHLFICSFVHLFICSFVHLFICSFVHLFICSFCSFCSFCLLFILFIRPLINNQLTLKMCIFIWLDLNITGDPEAQVMRKMFVYNLPKVRKPVSVN